MVTIALGVVLLAGAPATLLPAGTAHAADRTLAGGRLDWAIKSSFQSYVTGPIAQGSWRLTGGSATVGGSRFRFHSATGSYDPDSGAFTAGYSGGVHFTAHRKPDGSYELDLTISRPRVALSGGKGTLYADMTSKEKGTGKVTTAAGVPLATLDASGLDTRGGGTPVALDNLPATLTAQGARAFAGYYPAGTPLDPVSFSADVRVGGGGEPGDGTGHGTGHGQGDNKAEGEDKDPHKGEDTGQGQDGGKGDGDGAFADAAVDWGVRRTFREYVTGPVARGRWRLSDGAQDGGALFRFPDGSGAYDARRHTLDAHFSGTLRFTGTHLDLALSAVTVTVRDGTGTLSADVTTGATGGKGAPIIARNTPLVTFDAGQLSADNGLIAVKEAPTKLTAEGAKAFAGMYPAGTAMDPVSLAVAVKEGTRLPALPDLGSDPTSARAPQTKPQAEPRTADRPGQAAEEGHAGSAARPLSLVAGAIVLAGAATFRVLRTRRRRAAPNPPPPTGS
ncbi:HtaA domain-containing protein [Streptomyces sp. NBRC 110611]|uniref:HtaA domain-containing protein n=1 Tax=Streptomyces sp. NBRC 110611 TaxID=1621259 RepID=UPI00082BC4A2|nr:HtaA domain-containing protein [Streptomyces sp. NBRC 110611]